MPLKKIKAVYIDSDGRKTENCIVIEVLASNKGQPDFKGKSELFGYCQWFDEETSTIGTFPFVAVSSKEYPYSNNYKEILLFIRDQYAEKEFSDLFTFIHTISSNDWINDSITGSQGQFIPETACEVCKKAIETGHLLPHIYKKRIIQFRQSTRNPQSFSTSDKNHQ